MNDQTVEGAIRRVLAGRRDDATGPCPDANVIAAFLEARLDPTETTRFEAHAADCGDCRRILALSLELAAPEKNRAIQQARPEKRSSYQISPVRLALGATFVLIVGVILFQATRESGMNSPQYQIARQQQPEATSGKGASALVGGETKAGPGQAITETPSRSAQGSKLERAAEPPEKEVRASAVEPKAAGRPAEQKAAVIRPTVPAPVSVSEATKPATADALAEVPKDKYTQADIAALKDKLAPRGDEAKGTGSQVANLSMQLRKETVIGQANEVIAAQNANLPMQTANTQLQTANTILQNANVAQSGNVSQSAAVGAQSAGDVSQIANTPAKAGGAIGAAAKSVSQFAGGAAADANTKGINPVLQAIAEAGLGKTQRQVYNMTGALKIETGKKVGDRIFYRTRNYLVDSESLKHRDAPTREIARDSREYADMVKREPRLADLPSDVPIVLYWSGGNCLIR